MSGGGLKKCKPRTRSGCCAAAAMAVMLNDDVLDARSVSGEQIESSCLKISRLRSSFSGAAAILEAGRGPKAIENFLFLLGAQPASCAAALQKIPYAPESGVDKLLLDV